LSLSGGLEEQRDDLEGFAQAHVAGQAGTEAQCGHSGQPTDASFLVGSEGGIEAGGERLAGGRAHFRQALRQPRSGVAERPLGIGRGGGGGGIDWQPGEPPDAVNLAETGLSWQMAEKLPQMTLKPT
jgi:hypothetical protein